MSLPQINFSVFKMVSVFLIVLPLLAENPAQAAEDCRSIKDDAERLACWDKMMAPPAPAPAAVAPAAAAAPAAEAPAAKSPEVLDDTIGIETVKGGETDKEELLVKGHVSSCREVKYEKYLFYFDNGQIWQQKDDRTVPWRECDFDVTIEKDLFGYKMLPEGEKRSIRIARIK